MPTENLRDFYIKAGVLPPAAVWERTGEVTPVGEAARAKLYAIDPDFAVSENMLPRGEAPAPTQTPNPGARQAIWDRAFEADPDEAANAYLSIGKEASRKDAPTKEEPADKQKTSKELPKKEAISTKAPSEKPKKAEAAGGRTFDTLLQDAMSGNKNAIAFVNDIGRLNGFDKIQVTKDGIQYQEDGQWKTASAEEMRPMYDQAVKGIEYFKQYAAKQNKGQPQQARQAIPADLDPTVVRSLRAKAILQGDVGDLVAYQRLPAQLEQARAIAAYRRAAAARGYGGGYGESPNIEYQYLDDGSTLIVDKNTKQRLRLLDPQGQPAPLSYTGRINEYSDALDEMVADLKEDGAQLIPNGTMNPDVKLPNGRTVTFSQYQLAKEKSKAIPRGRGNLGTASTGESK